MPSLCQQKSRGLTQPQGRRAVPWWKPRDLEADRIVRVRGARRPLGNSGHSGLTVSIVVTITGREKKGEEGPRIIVVGEYTYYRGGCGCVQHNNIVPLCLSYVRGLSLGVCLTDLGGPESKIHTAQATCCGPPATSLPSSQSGQVSVNLLIELAPTSPVGGMLFGVSGLILSPGPLMDLPSVKTGQQM